MKTGLYIHFPHCVSKCPYCDFYSVCKKVDENQLLETYIRDIKLYPKATLTSIFIGGGTPSLMSKNLLDKLLSKVKKHFKLSKNCEISMEINPKTITFEKLQKFHDLGINRLSVGVQSLNDSNLKFLGRINNVKDTISLINNAKKIFDNISSDFIYALPNQTVSNWEKELDEIVKLNLNHLSIYQLTIAKNTPFGKIYKTKLVNDMDEKLFDLTNKKLKMAGYKNYEISNFCKSGFECRHNMLYWEGDNYFAIGPSAHARFQKDKKWYMVEHPADLDKWSNTPTKPKLVKNSDRAVEIILMHLRLSIPLKEKILMEKTGLTFNEVFNLKNLEKNNIKIADGKIKLTQNQRKLLNHILPEICK